MSQKIIGIDLGTYSIKVLFLERKVQEYQILDYIEQPLNLQSRLSHAEQIQTELKQVFSNHPMTPDVVCLSMPGSLLSARILKLPFTNLKKINQIIEFELEGYIPFQIEDVFFDYHILHQSEKQSFLLCTYMQEETFGKYMESLSLANIDAKYCGADFSDLAGIAQVAIVPHEGFYAICDIGHSKTNFLIMEGKELRYARTIGVGGYHFTRVIQRSFNINQEKAESLKLSRGRLFLREDDSDQISRILNRVARELVSSIKQTIMAASNHYGSISIPAMYCCGGGSKLVGIMDFLSFHLRTNVFELDSLNFINHQFDDVEEVSKTIPQVLSSALKPIYSNKFPKINFRKGPYAYLQDIQFIKNEFKTAGVLFMIIFLLGICYYFYAGYHYSARMASLDKQVEKVLETEYKELDIQKSGNNRGRTSAIKEYLKAVKSSLVEYKNEAPALGNPSRNIVAIMQDLSIYLPPKKDFTFEVTELNYSDDFLRLDARTDDPLNVDKVVLALKQSGKFGSIEVGDPQPKPNNNWDFVLKINLAEVAQK